MARLILSGMLKQLAHGVAEHDIEARDVRHLLRQLAERHPATQPYLAEEAFAVAIDGEIHQDAWLQPLEPHSEVHLIPPIGGG